MMPLTGAAHNLNALEQLTADLKSTEQMPVFFFGHGSPMNAIEQNEFSREWARIGQSMMKPNAILCISAHWLTRGTFVTAMAQPKTIHDFGGFPKELFDVQYPAPGSPQLADEVKHLLEHTTGVGLDDSWGLDHGCWSVVKHLYPDADVPVIQLSIDYNQPAAYHYALARQLAALRKKGILIVGSGNMVHNLGMVAWDKMDDDFLKTPKKWDARGVSRFMLFIGPISSIFDFITFAVLFFVFKANSPEHQALFQSGWFIEGLLSQTLIIHMIRTRKIPFIQSMAATPVLVLTALIMVTGILIPFSPFATMLKMQPLPLHYFPWLAGILFAYCLLTQWVKQWFIKKFHTWL